MRRNLVLIVLWLVGSPLATRGAPDCDVSLPSFEIEDQFREKHTRGEFAERVNVFVWSDRKGSEFAAKWEEMLDASLRGQIEGGLVTLRAVAHTKGAPFFVKGRIRGNFSEDPEDWALLDWDGVFRKAFDPPEEQVTILVFDREGCLVARRSGTEVVAQDLAEITAAAQRALMP